MKTIKIWLVVFLSMVLTAQSVSGGSRLILGQHAIAKRTLIVCPGSSQTESGANLISALDSVTGTADQPWLIKIEPGIYDLGQSALQMKPHVDIEGSGQAITVIKGRIGGTDGLVRGSSDAEIRELTVNNTFDGDDFGIGIRNNSVSPVLRNVTIELLAGCDWPYGIYNEQSSPPMIGVSVRVLGSRSTFGIWQFEGVAYMKDLHVEAATSALDQSVYGIFILAAGAGETPNRLENVRSSANGGLVAYGLRLGASTAEADNVDCRALNATQNYGIYMHNTESVRVTGSSAAAEGGSRATGIQLNNAAASFADLTAAATGASVDNSGLRCETASSAKTIEIDHCRISGGSYSIYENDADYTLYAGDSKLDGPVSKKGTWHCAQCYDGGNGDLNDSCQ